MGGLLRPRRGEAKLRNKRVRARNGNGAGALQLLEDKLSFCCREVAQVGEEVVLLGSTAEVDGGLEVECGLDPVLGSAF